MLSAVAADARALGSTIGAVRARQRTDRRLAPHQPFAVVRRNHPIMPEAFMRCLALGTLMLAAACTASDMGTRRAEATAVPTALSFDGADYANEAAKTAHGKRIATLF